MSMWWKGAMSVALLAVLCAAGCGGGAPESPGGGDAQPAEAADEAPAQDAAEAAEPEENGEEQPAASSEGAPKKSAPAEAAEAKPEATPAKEDAVPDVFKVKFECSNGDFVVECHKDWAPRGVERFHELVTQGFFPEVKFFRVVTKPRPFVVQFGISGDPKIAAKWRDNTISDDPVKKSNVKGTLTFATSGPNSRTTQLFINLGDNKNLDGMGFAPIGVVVEGMETVASFNDEYQEAPSQSQGMIQGRGNAFLDEKFPGLDFIRQAKIVEE